MKRRNILIVDDDVNYLQDLSSRMKGKYEVETAKSEDEFWEKFNVKAYDLIVLDIRLNEKMKGKEGLEILNKVKKIDPDQEVLILTQYKENEFLFEALSQGATFISKKDYSISAIAKTIDILVEKLHLKKEVSLLRHEIQKLNPYEIIGNSEAILKIKNELTKAAEDGEVTVLITGESGTGKELVARNLHMSGIRNKGPFIAVAVSGLNKDTIYSELFGYEKGAFTGANQRKKGFFEEADGGILFLDEIGDLDPDIQVKLLRVLENKSFTRLGSTREVKIDVQFVAATNRNLEEMIKKGQFREDLYYRLKAFEIRIPPLRDRKEDIEPLTMHFINLLRKQGRSTAKRVSKNVIESFYNYNWPGNVRELKNVVEFAAIKARGEDVINLSHLPDYFGRSEINEEKDLQIETKDYKKFLAEAELTLIRDLIYIKKIKKKTELARILQYPNRFTFMRRIRRIFEKYPELKRKFPEVAQLFTGEK